MTLSDLVSHIPTELRSWYWIIGMEAQELAMKHRKFGVKSILTISWQNTMKRKMHIL